MPKLLTSLVVVLFLSFESSWRRVGERCWGIFETVTHRGRGREDREGGRRKRETSRDK